MLRIFYESVMVSAILYTSKLRVADANRFDKLICKASNVVDTELDSLMVEVNVAQDIDNPGQHLSPAPRRAGQCPNVAAGGKE